MSWLELLFTLNLGRCSLENFKCLDEKWTFTLVLSWLHMDVRCSSYNMTNEWLSYRYVGVIKLESYLIHSLGIEMCHLPRRKWTQRHLWRFSVSKCSIRAFSFNFIFFLFLTFFSFLPYMSSVYIIWLPALYFCEIPRCVNKWVSESIYVSCTFSWNLFCLFCTITVYCII